MNANNEKTETCRNLISELRWTERHAEQSARIAVSKAVWLGIEKAEVIELMHKSSAGGKAKAVVSVIMAEGENS